jgi:hypothetical protein
LPRRVERLWLADGDLFRVEAMVAASPEHHEYERRHPHVPEAHSLAGRVLTTRKVVHIPDVLADPQYEWGSQKTVVEGRYDYGALGPVTNLASRLSTRAEAGQTLISQRVFAAVENAVDAQPVGEIELKGFGRPVAAYEVRALRP